MPDYKVTIPMLKGWSLTGFVPCAPTPLEAKLIAVQEIKQLYPQFVSATFFKDRITAEEVVMP